MNTALAATRAARLHHALLGDPTQWSSADFEAHQNLAAVAAHLRRERWRRPLRRTRAVVLFGYAALLYTAVETAGARTVGWKWLDRRLDRTVERLDAVLAAGHRAGDRRLVERVDDWENRIADALEGTTTAPRT